jgi:hypothetical protein
MARSVWILLLAVLFATQGCERNPTNRTPGKVTPEDVRRDAGQAINTAVEYSQQTKEDFQKKLEVQLNELDAKIAKLREKGSDLKDEAKANWDRKLADLETKRDQSAPNWPRSVTQPRPLGRTSRREPSRPGTIWTKPSVRRRESSDR